MLMPDVTEILDDPEIGGGQPFTVIRNTVTRTLGSIVKTPETFNLSGNIQPQSMSSQTSTSEDTLNEGIVIYAKFAFQAGTNDGGYTFIGADEILYDGKRYRVTNVNNWSKWGFSIANATRVMDMEEDDPEPEPEEDPGTGESDPGTGVI